MGKINKVLLMLDLLGTGNKYTVRELSEKIGVTERMVRYYKNEIENSGINIETFMGPNGGYFILNKINSYNKFNKYDIDLLKRCYEELKKDNFEFIDKLKLLINKVEKLSLIEEEKCKFNTEIDNKKNNDFVELFEKYIKNKERIKISYEDISGVWKERIIHPLQMFQYNNNIYITAFCELRNDIRHFELNRIKIINT